MEYWVSESSQANQPTMELFTQLHWYPHSIFIHRNCSLIFSKTKNHMTKSNLVSTTYYVVFVCVSELKRNIYANPVYANCIPNEFDVIIIMRVQTKYTLTHICRVCLCKMHVTNWHTHTCKHVQSFEFGAFFALVLRSFFDSRFISWKRCHTPKHTILILYNRVDWDRMRIFDFVWKAKITFSLCNSLT